MTRTNKWTVHEKASEPRWFTKNDSYLNNPTKVKKDGAGNHNWGKPGDELDGTDMDMTTMRTGGRRNSNHEMNCERMQKLEDNCNQEFDL
ncbi:translation machinery-associated protein 10 [Diutina catenulata]